MRILKNISELKEYKKEIEGLSLGFIPTMGALHRGHASLIKRSVSENQQTIVSIFVNPTQFNDPQDFDNYPSTLMDDINYLIGLGINAVFLPNKDELYPDGYRYKVIETEISQDLCGKDRPGHFEGVLTIVMKLLNLTLPKRAYFGEKDFQQLDLVKGMVNSFFLDTEVIGCPIVRDDNGLALSSRNKLLTQEEKDFVAENFSRPLTDGVPLDELKERLQSLGVEIDYLKERNNRRFGAIKMNNVRLIDNA